MAKALQRKVTSLKGALPNDRGTLKTATGLISSLQDFHKLF